VSRPPRVLDLPTPGGPARAHLHLPAARVVRKDRPVLVLGHGAGGGVEARDLAALAAELPALGITVVLVEQPWRVAGRRVAGPPAALDRAWCAVLADPALRAAVRLGAGARLVVGGRSAGARVACRTAEQVGADAVVALAFPLHPPGRPERSRAGELTAVTEHGLAVLVVQGERDAFGGPGDLPAGPSVAAVPCADHGFAVPKRAELGQADALAFLVAAVAAFV
jgi:uncharacterized protein